MKMDLMRLGDELRIERIPVGIDPEREYTQIGIRSFGNGIFHRDKVSGSELGKLKYFEVHPERLIVSNIMAWEGAIAVSAVRDAGCIGSHRFLSYVPSSKIDIRYLNFYFQSEAGRIAIKGTSTGTVLRNQTLSMKDFENLLVPLPELSLQRSIAARLDSVMSGIKQVDDLRGRRARLLAAHQESLVSRVSGGATDSDELDKLLHAARSPINIDESTKYRALGMRSFGKGAIRYPEAAGTELSKLRYFSFPANALALSNIKAWEGAIGVTSVEDLACVASNRFLFYIAADDRINIRYLRYYLLSKQGLAQLSACSPGSADRNRTLSIKSFERIRVPLPSRPEQDRVAELLDSLSEHLDPVRTDTVVKSLRPSLLNAAFSGEL